MGLKVTEQILGKMLDSIGGVESVTNTVEKENNKDQKSLPTKQNLNDSLANPTLGENNCRIKVKENSPRISDEEDCDDNSRDYSDPANDDSEAVESNILS